jgi:DNA polymerase-3 subunit delta'
VRCAEAIGHELVLEGLWRAARARRMAHALCFVGPEGVGKFLAAERLALGLVCARGIGEPCGACGPCKRAKSDAHPDILVVDPTIEGLESISIGHVTPRADGPKVTIGQFLSLRPMEGGWRVVLVRESDRLVDEAQNALLKTLEEPGESTLLVLETSRPDRLLPTIHSRTVRVPFTTLDDAAVARVLAGLELEPQLLHLCTRFAGGAPGLAMALAERDLSAMVAMIEDALSGDADVPQLMSAWDELDGRFPGKTPASQTRAKARAFLDLLAWTVRDARRAAAGIEARDLPFGDLAARLALVPDVVLASSLEGVILARQDVDLNLAPDAAVERALLALKPPARTLGSETRC